MRKQITAILAAGILAGFGAAQSNADDSIDGLQAFEKGQYHSALRLLATEAEDGSTDALYALGLMHEYGLGVNTSTSQAASYYFKGAKINTRQNRRAQARLFATALERTAY